MTAPVPALELRGLTVRYDSVPALDRITLVLQAGEITCVLGENGSGKSTLVSVVSGLRRPAEGSRDRSSADRVKDGGDVGGGRPGVDDAQPAARNAASALATIAAAAADGVGWQALARLSARVWSVAWPSAVHTGTGQPVMASATGRLSQGARSLLAPPAAGDEDDVDAGPGQQADGPGHLDRRCRSAHGRLRLDDLDRRR